MSSLTATHAPKGLEGIVATNSSICYIDGDRGVLAYRGIDIHELADHSNFEETCYLLWFGKLPSRRELRELHDRIDATSAEVAWTMTGYTLALASVIPMTGWAADRFGTKRLYLLAVLLFAGVLGVVRHGGDVVGNVDECSHYDII